MMSNTKFSPLSYATQHDRWHILNLGSQWDRTSVPIFEAAARGRCVPLLKTLLTTRCTNDCKYCSFRASRAFQRHSWDGEKLAKVTMHLWREKKITGLFLTSSVFRDPDLVTERQLIAIRKLRSLGFTGYIHIRLMPGVSKCYVREAVELTDRLGVNLEAPTSESFSDLCPDKGGFKEAILKRLNWVVDEVQRARDHMPSEKFGFGRSGVDTQMIVGAVGETDWQHLKTTTWLYQSLRLRRVFYSRFMPVKETPLQDKPPCPTYREHRLYQCSFLARDYGFNLDDFSGVVDDDGFLPNIDPKKVYVQKNRDLYPIDLNEATYNDLMRIPRVGPITSKKIIQARKVLKVHCFSDLEKVVGLRLARKVAPYIDLKDQKLTYFLKNM
jgi:predicted DNA-binding helix-hairpin-helix protein